MLEISYSIFFIWMGIYIIWQGLRVLKTKDIPLGPSEKFGLGILRYFKGAIVADEKEKELKRNKNPEKIGRNNLLFGCLILLIGIFRIIMYLLIL